jgi:hypothetical protein
MCLISSLVFCLMPMNCLDDEICKPTELVSANQSYIDCAGALNINSVIYWNPAESTAATCCDDIFLHISWQTALGIRESVRFAVQIQCGDNLLSNNWETLGYFRVPPYIGGPSGAGDVTFKVPSIDCDEACYLRILDIADGCEAWTGWIECGTIVCD